MSEAERRGAGHTVLLTNIGRLFTAGEDDVLTNAAVLFDGEQISWVGHAREQALVLPDEVIDVDGALVTPGLIDAHTHPVYAGNRLEEIALRSAGASYSEIAAAGGGIQATVEATRAAGADELADEVRGRLASWLVNGTTTVEAKTGYHLNRDGELAAVELLADLDGAPGLPRLEITFLAAHDRPCSAQEAADWCPDAAKLGARFVDIFCDDGYFSVAESRYVLEAGKLAGLRPRIHADELVRTGAAKLAAELGAVSADHLLCARARDAQALAEADVVATLCPVTAMSLRRFPPARLLASHGVPLALGSDHSPGQSGTTSMSLVIGLAVHLLGMSVAEALRAATVGGALSLARTDRGQIRPGMLADLVVWDADHEGAFAWHLGLPPRQVFKAGSAV